MDLSSHNNNIEDWFLKRDQTDFPDEIPYVANYISIVHALQKIQNEVNAGADFIDKQMLTRHDSSHIKKVISQISSLVTPPTIQLTAFEVFQLLLAVQIHDIKNIEGRELHEIKAISIFSEEGLDKIYSKRITIELIGKIASCHAGYVTIYGRPDKDKINAILGEDNYYSGKYSTNAKLLASLLRLADELADEPGRSYEYLLKKNALPKKSEVFHKFASCIDNIHIDHDGKTIYMEFHIEPFDAKVKFSKYSKATKKIKKVYLLDEIYERCLKTHWETVYCMRFLRPQISLNQVVVSITILGSSASEDLEHFINPPKINFVLRERGYPNDSIEDGLNLIRLNSKTGSVFWTGATLKKYVETHNLS